MTVPHPTERRGTLVERPGNPRRRISAAFRWARMRGRSVVRRRRGGRVVRTLLRGRGTDACQQWWRFCWGR
ncbi:hypothetical protein A8924_3162 [Saccharopolyspora erythraea NRRL 2338]|nr:hypothetical protein A8924_3162 [Saccharopolyspora erythraea NRRL 2338]